METRALDLRHGPTILVRPLANGDVDTVAAILGDESRCLAQLAAVDSRHHALVAHVVGDSRPAGLAQLTRTGARGADVAIVVADRYHRRGIGSALTRLLHDDARAAGITEITALAGGTR